MNHAGPLLAALACVAACHLAHADGSRLGSDGDVAEAGDCGVEVGFERKTARTEPRQRESALRLACGIGWQTELEAALARQRANGTRGGSITLEAKTTLRERADGHVGWALAVGIGADRVGGGPWRSSEHSVALEATQQLGARWLVEAKLGAVRERRARSDATLWAVAIEHALVEAVEVRAELGGDDRSRPLASIGLRYEWWPDHAVVKLSYAARTGPERDRRASLALQFDF